MSLLLIRLFSCTCHTAHYSNLATRGCKKHPLGEKATLFIDIAQGLGADDGVIQRPGQGLQEGGRPGDREVLRIVFPLTSHLHTKKNPILLQP